MSKILIDPGHGGNDPGAIGHGRKEKDDVLRLSQLVGNVVLRHGVQVDLTRGDDRYLSLQERTALENKLRPDLFVSIHRNSYSSATAKGVETYSYKTTGTGRKLAEAIQNQIVNAGLATANRGVKTANFYVLKNTIAPAALVEVGFISNAEDNALFEARISDYAEAIAKGILEVLGIPYKPVEAPKQTPTAPKEELAENEYWRVVVASYKEYNNAVQMKDELKSKGINSFIVKSKV